MVSRFQLIKSSHCFLQITCECVTIITEESIFSWQKMFHIYIYTHISVKQWSTKIRRFYTAVEKMRREIEKPFEKWATNGRRRMNERIKSRSWSDISSVHIIRYHDHRKEEKKRLKRRKKNKEERERLNFDTTNRVLIPFFPCETKSENARTLSRRKRFWTGLWKRGRKKK